MDQYGSKALLNRVKQHLSGVHRKDGRLVFDDSAASIINPAYASGGKIAMRGRVFDRNGRVLSGPDEKTGKRHYPLGSAGFHPVGYAGRIYDNRGIERALDPYLDPATGKPWWRYFWRGDGPAGSDVTLTLSASVQKAAWEALDGKTGSVVVLDPETGDVLALASSPSFDPNTPAGITWDAAANDPEGPFCNRALERRYPPGSLFKLVVAAAALENSHAPELFCPEKDTALGVSDRRYFGHMNYHDAIAQSCNVYFARLGTSLGPKVPEQASAFGFMQVVDLLPEFCENSMAVVPGAAFAWPDQGVLCIDKSFSEMDIRRNPRLVAQGSIGQNIVAATPLQMAMVGAAIANKGRVMRPRLVLSAGGKQTQAGLQGRAISGKTAEKLTSAMKAVMEKGTGRKLPSISPGPGGQYRLAEKAGADALQAAGKTGTAEVGGSSSHAWFLGFAPADDPAAVVCVLVEHGGWGASTAGPVGMKVLAAALNAN